MQRLSVIINDIYNKFLPLADKVNVKLDLDFADTTREVADPDTVKRELEAQLRLALDNSDEGTISIGVSRDAISLTDSATIFSPALCRLFSTETVEVKSRVGFGTTIRILLPQKAKDDIEIIESKKLDEPVKHYRPDFSVKEGEEEKPDIAPKAPKPKKAKPGKATRVKSTMKTRAAARATKKAEKTTAKAKARAAKKAEKSIAKINRKAARKQSKQAKQTKSSKTSKK